jgi:cyclophilin family peptidyl-prolyl cis-trans isomerase
MVVSVAAGAFAANQTTNNNSSTVTPTPAVGTETPVEGEGRQVKTYDAEPQVSIDTAKKYTATIEIKGKGDIRLELFASEAPRAVNNFVFLARDGFYDGLTFFRVVPGFVAQAGDPTCTSDPAVTCMGSGGPGYFLTREDSGQVHEAGVLAMGAPQGGEEISGSQFYITYAAQSHLDGRDTVFGRVVEGQDVLDSLATRDPNDPTAQTGDEIVSITIEEK